MYIVTRRYDYRIHIDVTTCRAKRDEKKSLSVHTCIYTSAWYIFLLIQISKW